LSAFRQKIIQPIVDLWSLIVGLKVTGKYFTQKLITVHYPRETVADDNLDTYGGHIELVGSPRDPATPRCISCMMCVTNCPSRCLTVVKQKPPKLTAEQKEAMAEAKARGEKVKKPRAPKNPLVFTCDYSLCSLCATCIENCPVNALRFSHTLYWAATCRDDLTLDLLDRLRQQAPAAPQPAAKER